MIKVIKFVFIMIVANLCLLSFWLVDQLMKVGQLLKMDWRLFNEYKLKTGIDKN